VDLKVIPQQWRNEYLGLLSGYVDMMSINSIEVRRCQVVLQNIMLQGDSKVSCTLPYRVPHYLKEVVIKYIDKLLVAGNICRWPRGNPVTNWR
jgi:hypothetical protein